MRIRHIVIRGLSSSTAFSTLSHKRHKFRKQGYWEIECVLEFVYNFFSEIFYILRKTERDMIENVYWSSCKVPFIVMWSTQL